MTYETLELEVQSMAHDMGDDFGDDAETVLLIARHFDLDPVEVQRILGPAEDDDSYYEYDDDGQPDELTEWMDFDPDC